MTEEAKGNGDRWEPNTYVDGVNVGGKFKPKDGKGIVKKPDEIAPDEQKSTLNDILSRAKQLSAKTSEISPADAIEAMTNFGKIIDTGSKELKDRIRTKLTEARTSSQTAFLNAMYDLEIVQAPPPPPKSFAEILSDSGQRIFSSLEEIAENPDKIQSIIAEGVNLASVQGSMLGPEIIGGLIFGSTMIDASCSSASSVAASTPPTDSTSTSYCGAWALNIWTRSASKGLVAMEEMTRRVVVDMVRADQKQQMKN